MRIVGSKWFKVDFHCHSPASDDFPRDPSQSKCTNREWLLELMSKEIDCVVLSDHNTGKGIQPIRDELKILAEEHKSTSGNGYRPLALMPGVELTAVDNTHILAIFRDDVDSLKIDQFVSICELPATQKNHQLVLQSGTASIIKKAKGFVEEILIIPAHVDMPKGVFQNSNQTAVEDIFKQEPHAVEIIGDMEDLEHKYQRTLIKNLAHVKGSDAHSIKEMNRNYTWVKMVEPSFEGIKVALTDPEHCIIRSPEQPPSLPSDQIMKVSLKSELCQTKSGEPINIEFSPWYTSIIGSRGSGKSTLIEAIRLGLRRDTRQHLPSDQLLRMAKFKSDAMGDGSSLEIEYRKSNELYKLTWSNHDTAFFHQNEEQQWVPENTFNTSRFPVSIYSQKMLYEIATKHNAFLRVIDASETVNYSKWKLEKESLEESYKRHCIDERVAEKVLAGLVKTKGEFDDIQRKLKLLKDSGLEPIQSKLRIFQNDNLKVEDTKKLLNNLIASIKLACDNAQPINIDSSESGLGKWQLEVNEIQTSLITAVKMLIDDSQRQIDTLSQVPYLITLKQSIFNTKTELSSKVEALESEKINPTELNELLDSEATLRLELANEEQLKEALQLATNTKIESYQKLILHRRELTKLRQKFIEDLGLDDLRIQILPLACDNELIVNDYQKHSGIERFSQYIFDDSNKNTLLSDLISINKYLPNSLESRYSEVEKLKRFHKMLLSKSDATYYSSIHRSLRNRLENISLEQLDAIHCWFPEDGLNIKFKDTEGGFRQLESASPGQKSASMLSFLMSYGSDPLILDQPEDDLDCGMLSSAVIPAISNNKKRRQLIIVSHSAPIVVNGDAELVIGMKQQSRRLEPCITGGLQDSAVKGFICGQMEGGEKAFKTRFKRILG